MLSHLLIAALTFGPRPVSSSPHALIDSAISAFQRTSSLRDARTLRLVGLQHEFMLGNAERAEGPWRVTYSKFTELHDLAEGRLRRTDQGLTPHDGTPPERVIILTDSVVGAWTDGRKIGTTRGTFEDLIDRVDGSPERALLLAARSSSLRSEQPVRRYGLAYDVVSFSWRNGRMRLELNRETHLPDAIEIVRPYPDNFRWGPFGDVRMRTEYVDWTVLPSGMYWPMQEKTSLNGEPLRDITFSAAAFGSSLAPGDSFVVSNSVRADYAAASELTFSHFRFGARGEPTEIRPGIVRVPDFWTETLVKQTDGVVLFEAHISARYLHDVIGEAHRRWPNAPIKALVMTSDPWAHLGGVREAIALGIPIYVHANSVPFLTALAKAPHTMAPDSLARAPRAPKFIPITGKTVIGRGDNRIELYPVRGPYAERMVMAYFPRHKLLYGADLVFPNRTPDGKPAKGYLETSAVDLRRAVAREHLDVVTLFCVQAYPPIAWRDFTGDIE